MGKELIINREKEIELLSKCLKQKESQLVVVYGRRRVGKTFLINQFFNNDFAFKTTGAYKESDYVQRLNFINELSLKWQKELDTPRSWNEAFHLLRQYIDELPKDKKQVVFFDELPWMNVEGSDFLPSFEHFWNNYGSSVNNLICVVCGSNASWLIKNIVYNKGGLFNRQSSRIYLEPFNLHEVEKYLLEKGFTYSRYDILELYMIMGGIPYYLNYLDPSISIYQNIDELFFAKKAVLHDEFDKLFKTLFDNDPVYLDIIKALSKKKSGLTRDEIVAAIKRAKNGLLSEKLDVLIEADFANKVESYYLGRKRTVYRLSDYYTLFYFHFIYKKESLDSHFWQNSYSEPSKNVWLALTFENVCLTHVEQIKRKLGISGVLSNNYAWSYQGDENIKGAQIDLVIDRKDRVINLCEIKHSIDEFAISKDYEQKLREKINTFKTVTETRKSILLTFITTYGLKTNMYSGIAHQSVTMDDLFE